LVLLQKEYEKLQSELDLRRQKTGQIEQEHVNALQYWQDKFAELYKENQGVTMNNKQLENQLGKQAADTKILVKVFKKYLL
jgi:sulfur relay (sulfurtransferase) DsrC/TusE family protein